jgi:3-oxoacyl-[acyl-carrier-protein] synthase-3
VGPVSVPVGIVDLAWYAPPRFMTAAELAEVSGIPERVIVEKFGLIGKHLAAPDEHVSDMCISAARPLLARNDPGEIDAVVYFGSHWKDYGIWQAAPKIQHALGIEGFALELVNVSCGAPVALKVVRDMLAADQHLRSVLLVGASRESGLLDYANPRSRFMYTFGDGAVAVLLRRGHAENQVLGSSLLTDGSFSDHVRVPAGGSVHPPTVETIEQRMHSLDVFDPEDMKLRLDPITLKNFLTVAREAMERSGHDLTDVDLLLPIHMKRSIHEALVEEIGPRRSVYLDHFGHMSAVDPLLGLAWARDEGLIASGDIALILAAGTGYTWAASVVRWGPHP